MVSELLKARVPLLLLLGMIAFLVVSYGYSPEERALPVLVAWATIFFLALEILVQAGTPLGKRIDTILQGREAKPAAEPPPIGRALRYAVGWTGLVVGLSVLIGLLPAVFIYIGLSLRIDGGKPLPRALIAAAAVTVFAWLLFEWGLSYELYRGMLIELFAA
jgi:hypothetical protein